MRPATWSTVIIAAAMTVGVAACSTPGNVFSLDVGDCFDDPDDASEAVADLPLVACDEPHDNEVYAVIELPDEAFPGDEAILERAETDCLGAFEPYVGTAYGDSTLFATWLVPTEASWSDGDREVVCVLFDREGQLEASMRGAGR